MINLNLNFNDPLEHEILEIMLVYSYKIYKVNSPHALPLELQVPIGSIVFFLNDFDINIISRILSTL